MAKAKRRFENLAQEPMVFCYSGIFLDNFIIDDDNSITVVNFKDASILPSCFCKYALVAARHHIRRDIRGMVTVPETEGIDNMSALYAIGYPMLVGSGSFWKAGQRFLGPYTRDAPDQVHKVVTDEQGQPVTMTFSHAGLGNGTIP